MPDIDKLREILSGWGSYGPHFNEQGSWIGTWWTMLPIADMTDDEVLYVARRVSREDRVKENEMGQERYEQLMADARRFNAKMDRVEVEGGWATPHEGPLLMTIFTVMMAIKAGIVTEDWTCVAEAQGMLESLSARLEARSGKTRPSSLT